MIDHRAIVRCLLYLAASIGLASCAVSDATQYYTLGQPAARRADSPPSAFPRGDGGEPGTRSIGVGPVSMPGYLRRSQIVTRPGRDQVDLAMFQR